MIPDLSNRIAVVTGGAQGLGKAMVVGLLGAGARVAVVDLDETALGRLREEVASSKLTTFAADLSRPEAGEVIGRIQAAVGHVDILVNNAGIGQAQIRADYHVNSPRFYEISDEQWSRALAVNASAVFRLSRAVAEPMIRKGWGRIITNTTSLGTMLRGGWTPYGPTKASAEALSSVMAADLEGTGVTVNVIVPGGIANTGMIPTAAPYAREELIQPEVMVPPLLWLASPAADSVTGRRYLCVKWDANKSPEAAAEVAGAPIGWRDIAVLPIAPSRRSA